MAETRRTLEANILEVKQELKADGANMEQALKANILEVKQELKAKIADIRCDIKLLRWMTGFQMALIVAVLWLLVRLGTAAG